MISRHRAPNGRIRYTASAPLSGLERAIANGRATVLITSSILLCSADALSSEGHDLFLSSFVRGQFTRNAAFAHNDDSMAHPQNLWQFGRDHDDCLTPVRQIVKQSIDLALRTHVDATSWLIEDEHFRFSC